MTSLPESVPCPECGQSIPIRYGGDAITLTAAELAAEVQQFAGGSHPEHEGVWAGETFGECLDRYTSEVEQRVAKLEEQLAHPGAALTPETARALLRECVTVVSPGETLVIRVPDSWTLRGAEDYQRAADEARADGRISFPVLVVTGEELAVAQPDGA